MKGQLGFLVDIDKCIGCHSCEMACKNQNQLDPEIRWRIVYPMKGNSSVPTERCFLSLACNHCEKPECMRVCPVRAYTKLENGIVFHDKNRCIGCRMCIMACPYQVPQFNSNTKKVEKCNLCAERIEQGLNPFCVDGCITDAITLINFNEFNEIKAEREIEGFPNPNITNPSVRFIPYKPGVQIRRDV
ncbi:MAG: 4Fe-4S dicluster domain-containing protein [Clostridia bacterium]|jgi:DMSO reductase iron-sulfur subunit|nr:4Fe-4S dicluster domain-containing protein [Clostridia bacterium]